MARDTTTALAAIIEQLGLAASRSTEGTRSVADAVADLAAIAGRLNELTSGYETVAVTRISKSSLLTPPAAHPEPARSADRPDVAPAAGIELF